MAPRLHPVEIEMDERVEKMMQRRLERRGAPTKRITLRGIRLAPGSQKVLLLSDAQVRDLKQGKRVITMATRQLKMNKTHCGGFLISLISALVAGVSTALVEAAVGGGLDEAGSSSKTRGKEKAPKRGDGLFLNKYDHLFLRRNNHLARVSTTRGGSGLQLIPPTEKERSMADTHHEGEGLFLLYGNSVFMPTEFVQDHIFKILYVQTHINS